MSTATLEKPKKVSKKLTKEEAVSGRAYYKGPDYHKDMMIIATCTKYNTGASYRVGEIFVFSAPTRKGWFDGTGGLSGDRDIRIHADEFYEFFTEGEIKI